VRELHELPSPEVSGRGAVKAMVRALSEKDRRGRIPFISVLSWGGLLRVAAALFVILCLGWGMLSLSARAVPGDLLYPVKLLTEKARFYLTFDPKNRVELRVVFSEERLREMREKYRSRKEIDTTLIARMLREAEKALEESAELPDASRGIMISRVGFLTAYQNQVLRHLEQNVAPDDKKRIAHYSNLCNERCRWMHDMMLDMGMRCPCCDADKPGSSCRSDECLCPPADKVRRWMKKYPARCGNSSPCRCRGGR